jgi:thioredoxin-like negative regulator of GroEL
VADKDFETGYALLTEEKFNEVIPHLARAVQLDSENARYHAFYGQSLITRQQTASKSRN